MSKKVSLILMAALAVFFLAGFAAAQEEKASVPELIKFHDVIKPIWHDAYPAKDYAALRGFTAQIKALAAPVYAAKLPGILHEREAKWKEGLEAFRKAVDGYAQAAAGQDDAALLAAAEALHTRYEMLGRVISPVLKEVGAFHEALYPFVHKYAPDKQYDKIRGGAADLLAKAEAVGRAPLSARQAGKAEAF